MNQDIADKSHFMNFLAVMLTIMVAGIVVIIVFFPIPDNNKEAFYMISGSIVTAWLGFMTYYSGSSAGSTKKDATIGSIAKSASNGSNEPGTTIETATITSTTTPGAPNVTAP